MAYLTIRQRRDLLRKKVEAEYAGRRGRENRICLPKSKKRTADDFRYGMRVRYSRKALLKLKKVQTYGTVHGHQMRGAVEGFCPAEKIVAVRWWGDDFTSHLHPDWIEPF